MIYLLLFNSLIYASVIKKVIKASKKTLVVQIEVDALTEADLYPISLIIGLPSSNIPKTQIEFLNKTQLPYKTKIEPIQNFEWINQQSLQNLETGTIRISPVANSGEYYKKIIIKIEFNDQEKNYRIPKQNEKEVLKSLVFNWDIAKSWIKQSQRNLKKQVTLPMGKWINFQLEKDGMNSITFESLKNVIPDISVFDPRSFCLYMSNELGRNRTQAFNQEMTENLIEISILVLGEEDGSFDDGDRIVFYGRGPSGFDISDDNLEWGENPYFLENTCWALLPYDSSHRGKRIDYTIQPESGTLIDYGISAYHLESDLINLEASGTEWVGSPILSGGSQTIITNLPNPKDGANISIDARFRGHSLSGTSSSYHQLKIHHGSMSGEQVGSTANWTGSGARLITDNSSDISLNNGENFFFIRNVTQDDNSSPYVDYFEISYGRELLYTDEFDFVSPINGQDVRFSFSGDLPESIQLLMISDPTNPKLINIDNSGFCNINLQSENLAHFILFDLSNINSETNLYFLESHDFFGLRQSEIQANYLIIGPEEFKNEADRLINLRSPAIYASLESIYNEFSAGNKDPMAIRSFIQWTQENWQQPHPNCALLLGDGGYDYRNITGQSSIIVPTIQVQSNRTYATDDLLVSVYGNIPEIATGRFPARNIGEVSNFIDKVLEIETNPIFGPWRQRVTLIADDAARPEPNHGSIATGKSHTINSEQIAALIPSSIYIDKLYMMEYPEVSDASAYGVIKPAATEALFNSLNNGTAIISYIGHGSPYQLAQEKLLHLDRGDLNQINTGSKLPLWVVGTCSFGHFDDPLTESFSEELIRDPMNSASMVISTTRPITVTGNERYTLNLFEKMFNNGQVSDTKIGILLQSIKDGTSESQYFHLFGDPAMQLPMPKNLISNLSISPDTLKTLGTGSFSGSQLDINNSGNGFILLLDADRNVTREYEISSEAHTLSYTLTGATLFRGQFSFSGQTFSGNIRVPQDIAYSNESARLLTYLYNNETDIIGSLGDIQLIGGAETQDKLGPKITFETTSGTVLEYGDHHVKNEDLIIRLSDPLGINLTNEIGHEIILKSVISNSSENITKNFYYDQNSIITGTVNYPTSLEQINIIINAWDNANNPSEKEIRLNRVEINTLKIFNVLNFPNPFKINTQFTFEITQNADLILDLFTLGGRKIKSFKKSNISAGYHTIEWDGRDAFGGQIANGVYLYRLKATGTESTISYIGRCAKFK